jgi:hypothetical protein
LALLLICVTDFQDKNSESGIYAKNALRQTKFWTSKSTEMTVAVEIAAPHIVVVSEPEPKGAET